MLPPTHYAAKVTETGSQSGSDRGSSPSLAADTCDYREFNPQLRDSSSRRRRRRKRRDDNILGGLRPSRLAAAHG